MKQKNVRKLQRSSGSYTLRLPPDIIRELGWKERQKLVVKKRGRGIEIVDWPARQRKS